MPLLYDRSRNLLNVPQSHSFVQISCGGTHSVAVTSDGRMFSVSLIHQPYLRHRHMMKPFMVICLIPLNFSICLKIHTIH